MPALGIAQETGKLLQWLKSAGDAVTQGEVLMVVETDKATVEIEAPASGVLSSVTAKAGDDIPVGQTIAVILSAGEAPAEAPAPPSGGAQPAQPSTQQSQPVQPSQPPATPPAATPANGTRKTPLVASPLARRIAEEKGIDLSLVKPTGERIEKADVLA